MSRRISERTVHERLETVETMLACGSSTYAIQRTLALEWQTTHRQVREYIKRVKDAWVAAADAEDLPAKRENVRAMILASAAMAARQEQPGMLLRCADSLALLDGVRAPARTELSGPDGGPVERERVVILPRDVADALIARAQRRERLPASTEERDEVLVSTSEREEAECEK